MKKLIGAVVLLLMTVPLLASTDTVKTIDISTNTPQIVQSLADGLHILDNATPGTFYDWTKDGGWMAGVSTALYKKYYLSLDAGVVTPLENDMDRDHRTGYYMGGVRGYVGEFLVENVQMFKDFASQGWITDGLLKYTTGGLWIARDWDYAKWRHGFYLGFQVEFN